MAVPKVRLDHPGIAEFLKSGPVRSLVDATAAQVAAEIRSQGQDVTWARTLPLPVEVRSYTTDRAAASVTLAHPSGVAVQAKHGRLTKAASAVGLEVTEK